MEKQQDQVNVDARKGIIIEIGYLALQVIELKAINSEKDKIIAGLQAELAKKGT